MLPTLVKGSRCNLVNYYGANSSHCSAARQHGRSRRARSSRECR
jgi:hypothetical protein